MRIFYAFLIIVTIAILLILPVSQGIYDFRTDQRTDNFYTNTGVGATTAALVLHDDVYDNDTATIDISSDNPLDLPVFTSYITATRVVNMGGLNDNDTRTLTVDYDVYALSGAAGIDTLVSRFDLIWIVMLITFAPVALAAIFLGRA